MTIVAGKYTYGTETVQLFNYGCEGKVVVGAFTSIAVSVKMYLNQGKGHLHKTGTTYPFGINHNHIFSNHKPVPEPDVDDIVIGSDVWIGDGVTINPGIKIGDGAVIATNTHVIRNVPDYAIVGGNPMVFIRYRFHEDIIKEFKNLCWWNLDDSKINGILPYLQMEPTLEVFEKIYKKLGEL